MNCTNMFQQTNGDNVDKTITVKAKTGHRSVLALYIRVYVRKSVILAFQNGRTFSFNDILRLCTIVVNIAIQSRA